ncbi:hypothetical protein OA240_01990 [bacterium]|nr:hypothetical protein [bacterium]
MILLTFDTDHLYADEVEDFVRNYPIPGVATFFSWKPDPSMDLLQHEIQPHPHFSEEGGSSWVDTLSEFEGRWGKKGTVLRSHSLSRSLFFDLKLKDRGYIGTSNSEMFKHLKPEPVRQQSGLWELPIYYMDYTDLSIAKNWPKINHRPFAKDIIDVAIKGKGLYIFDFHPIHIMFNVDSLDNYHILKEKAQTRTEKLSYYAIKSYGVGNFYLDLVTSMKKVGLESIGCEAYLKKILS